MPNKYLVYTCLAIFSCANVVLSYDRFVNYTATQSVYDFASDNDRMWVASSGGLFRFNRASGTGTLYTDPAQLPDPTITSLCLDANHTLWIGTINGYLYKRPQKGRQTVIPSYFTAGWGINDLVLYGKFLIIGSNKGCSVFDTAKSAAIKNATGFGSSFTTPQVNAIAVFRDTLFLGCEQGVAKLCLAGCDSGKSLEGANFYDQSIWKADTVNRFPVKSFVVQQGSCRALHTPGALFRGQLITTSIPAGDNDSTELFADSNKIMAFPSRVTAISEGDNGWCYIGTKYNYFYLWNGSDTTRVTIDGPTFTTAQRVYVDREGLTWVPCSQQAPGISVFRNNRWTLYNAPKYRSMGWPIDVQTDFRGVAEDQLGRMWFGTTSVAVKRYDRASDSWIECCIGCINLGQGQFYQSTDIVSCQSWSKSDAIALDSTGFLWIASYNNNAGTLICHDPRYEPHLPDSLLASYPPSVTHYRYFFPPDSSMHSFNVGCLCVDAANNIIVGEGFSGSGRIMVFRHNGRPLEEGISAHTESPPVFGIVYDAAATRDTLTYIATSTGFYTLDLKLNTIEAGLWIRSVMPPVPHDTLIDSTLRGVRTIEMEDDRIIWLGTADSGLVRYDLSNNSKTIVNETQGLLSNRVADLSLDRKNGYLWIASERGVSRYSLGYSVGRTNTGTALVYPNPFSKRRHLEMIFEKLPPSSKVIIYTVSGSLVATLFPEENSIYGSACIWKPPATIVPGIYLYTVQSSAKNSRGKIIVTP